MSRREFSNALSRERSVRSVLRVIHTVEPQIDAAIQNAIESADQKPACRQGCSHCCHHIVYCRITDVIRATTFIRESFAATQIDALKERLYVYERAVAPHFGLNPRRVRIPCPLLEDGLCTIYPARPNRCRAMNSTDASVCELIKLDASLPETRPEVEDYATPAIEVVKGTSQAFAAHGYPQGAVDFGRALAIALEKPNAIHDFLAGSQVFAPAMLRRPISKNARIAAQTAYYRSYHGNEEAEGEIQPSDLVKHFELFTEGDTKGAVQALTGSHPVNAIRRIVVPMLYRGEDEVAYWRQHVLAAIRQFGKASFDPREAFDALRALATFEIAYQQDNVLPVLSELGTILVERIAKPCFPDLSAPMESPRKPGKFRVGYISENLTSSNGGSWALGWLENHGEEIETYAFCLSEAPDAFTSLFKAGADHFFHMPKNVAANARFIRSLDLDLLIFTDIGMSLRNYQYAILRLARKQATAWGHPVTSGLSTIDLYLSSDLMEPANGQDHYSEQLIRLPNSGLCYPRSRVPASRMVREDFGLDDGPLYLSVQNPMKYLPRWDHLYREICVRTGRPIVFVEGPLPMEKNFLKERFVKAGINAKWLPGLSGSDFIALIRIADCCLDTPGWNGGNTTIQALTVGVPVVTLPGEFMRGRHSLAFNKIAGVPGLIARDENEYVELACDRNRQKQAIVGLSADALYDDLAPVKALDRLIQANASA